jgi:2-keto-4-pentenoate hydratase
MTNQQQASNFLWNHWQNATVCQAISPEIQPQTRGEGYAIQALLEARSQHPLYGWKIAATSLAGQRHIGVDGPMVGRLLHEQVRPEGSNISLVGNRMRVAECEFAFVMGKDLPPRSAAQPYTSKEVLTAVKSLHPAIEIPDSRYEHFETVGAPQLIADNACAHLFVLGQAATCNWKVLDLASHAVTATVENPDQALPLHHHGAGNNVLGDPRLALTWMVNELSNLGITLKANAVVTTGTCIVPIAVRENDRVTVNFGAIGDVTVRFV